LKELIYFGDKFYPCADYNRLINSFIGSYEQLQKEYPKKALSWEADIEGSLNYPSASILNHQIKHYTYNSGTHDYQWLRPLLFDPETGKSIPNNQLFKDPNDFKAFAEKNLEPNITSPQTSRLTYQNFCLKTTSLNCLSIYFTDKGLLLYYNPYEADSYTDEPKELLLLYKERNDYFYYLSNLKLNKFSKTKNRSNMYPFMKTVEYHSIFGIFQNKPC
jgi:hypothetical protein